VIGFDDLRHLPVFDGVSDDALGRVASHAADVRIDEGQWLVREGDAASFYVLLAGTFDVMKLFPDGARRLTTRVPGDFIGELALVPGG
jgi:thioredoxin reductase (NADPH)